MYLLTVNHLKNIFWLINMFNNKDNYLINEEVFEYIKFKTIENIKYNDILVSVYEK